MTTQQSFLQDNDVAAFLDWLVGSNANKSGAIDTMHVDLNVRASGKVPGGIKVSFDGLSSATTHYKWNGKNWQQTRADLTNRSQGLRAALAAGDDAGTLRECDAILKWGGDRNRSVGAYPFIHGLEAPSGYFKKAAETLSLAHADLRKLGVIKRMNSMLTKIHALASDDGLPIYDSRVAVAIAAVVEIYRLCHPGGTNRLPAYLTFPAVSRARDVTTLFTEVASHGSVEARDAEADRDWTGAKVRLGWLLHESLVRRPDLFSLDGASSARERMHAFEAALFMVGYDARCIGRNFCEKRVRILDAGARAKRAAAGAPKLGKGSKTARTLVKKNEFRYAGDPECGVRLETARDQSIVLNADYIREICEEFAGKGWVDCSFDRGKDSKKRPSENSLSHLIVAGSEAATGRQLSSQHVSRIAAVLVDVGLCEFRKHQGRAQLTFDID